jgi:hypothetical protein
MMSELDGAIHKRYCMFEFYLCIVCTGDHKHIVYLYVDRNIHIYIDEIGAELLCRERNDGNGAARKLKKKLN